MVSAFTFATRAHLASIQRYSQTSRQDYYFEWLLAIGVPAFSVFVAFRSGEALIIHVAGFILDLQTLKQACGFRPFDRSVRKAFFPAHLSAEQKRLRLEIADDGIREHQGDIVSFAPWKDVTGTMIPADPVA